MARNSLKSVFNLIESAKDMLTPEQSFLNDFKYSMELDADKSNRKPSKTYKPSSMHCIRNMYYQIVGADIDEGKSNYSFVGICNQGSDIHERVQATVLGMKENGIDCEYVDVADFIKQRKIKDITIVGKSGMETKLRHDKLNLSFMCDGIIKYKNHYYILEIKTETVNKWWKRNGVDENHYHQATAYSIALGLNDVIFLYINRDVFDIKAYMFTPTDDMKFDLISLIEDCDHFVSLKQVPPKPDNINKKSCQYCGYATQCKKDL